MITSRPAAVRHARAGGERAVRRREFGWLARSGLLARGAVYATIGILALELAAGAGGKATNQQGALQTLAQQLFGKGLLIATAAGLAGYAIWRLVRAVLGHGREQREAGLDRIAGVVSAIGYGALCVTAVEILAGAGGGGSSGNPSKPTAGVLGWAGGAVLVALAGIVLVGVALHQGYQGVSRKFREDSRTATMRPAVMRGFTALGVFGHLARMIVFGLVGYGLVKAALDHDPHRAVGLDGALSNLAHASYGPLLLGLVAAGLIGFALFSIAEARYRKV